MEDTPSNEVNALGNGVLSNDKQRLAAQLGKQTDSASQDLLFTFLKDEDPIVRYNAILALGLERRVHSAVPLLQTLADSDPDDECREASVSVLGNMFAGSRSKGLLSFLERVAVNDSDEGVRRSAYRSALIVHGVPREEHLALLRDDQLVVDETKLKALLAEIGVEEKF